MKIHIYHAAAGHGHKKVAEVIAETFKNRGLVPPEVEVFDVLDFTSPMVRVLYPGTYYHAVKYIPKVWGWFYETLDRPQIYKALYGLRRLHNKIIGSRLLKKLREDKPDAILCTHFFTAELFAHAKRNGKISSLLITVITDFFPHTFWVNEGTDYYWVMGEAGKKDLVRRGVPESRILAGGIPVGNAFKPAGRKLEIRRRWNFEEDRFTLLYTSGSFGLGHQEAVLRELEAFKDRVQCFVVCGNNHALFKKLSAQHRPYPVQIFGFVDFMPDLMEASDLVIAKSGGATTSESLVKGLPMIILEPIPGQETRNADFLISQSASFTMKEPAQIKVILKAIFDNPRLLVDKLQVMKKLARPNAAEDLATFVLDKIAKKS